MGIVAKEIELNVIDRQWQGHTGACISVDLLIIV